MVTAAAPTRQAVAPRSAPGAALRVLVGVQGEGLNGIDTYAEQVAAAAVAAGHDVTLLVTSPEVARLVAGRLDGRVRVEDMGLEAPGRARRIAGRLWHGVAMRRLERGMRRALAGRRGEFDVAHLNHPALAGHARPAATAVVVSAWFYPHAPVTRVAHAWAHNRGPFLKRAVLAAKSVSYYLGDARGFAAADVVVAPTRLLAEQLRSRGVRAECCPPPVEIAAAAATRPARGADVVRLVSVSGDLTHPRKNLRDALDAAGRLARRSGRRVSLEMIGRNGEALRSSAGALPGSVELTFPGALERTEVHSRVAAADALLLPSLYEEWGYVAVEALLLGTPVVTYPVYPFASMLDGGLGVVASEMGPEALAAAIERVLAGACRPDVASAAAERYGAASVGGRLSEIWRAVSDEACVRS
jgi:glycosyltransferase involved in cell wall biosynthesis